MNLNLIFWLILISNLPTKVGAYYATIHTPISRHVWKNHEFSKPFNCPECLRNGNVHKVSGTPSAWSNHVKQFHGKNHTPNLWSESEKSAYCPIFQESYTVRGFSCHYNRHQRTLELLYDCQECFRGGMSDGTHIKTLDDWVLHVRHVHNGGHMHGAILKTDLWKVLSSRMDNAVSIIAAPRKAGNKIGLVSLLKFYMRSIYGDDLERTC